MGKRYMCIWFRHLLPDWFSIKRPELKELSFVFTLKERGRVVITASSRIAESHGIYAGMPLADAKAMLPDLQAFDDVAGRNARLLKGLAEWCYRYTPIVAIDLPNGLILDVSGCAHLWGGEREYLREIITKLRASGYDARGALADTVGSAWAIARFGHISPIIKPGEQTNALLPLPAVALRLETEILQRLKKLGLFQIKSFITMPRSILRRRFGNQLLIRLSQALGQEEEPIIPIKIAIPFQERLPSMEPIRTKTGIEIAINCLLENLCAKLKAEGMGLRTAVLTCYRIDGKILKTEIGTNRPSNQVAHLFSLFELKVATIKPALGIELFILEAPKTEAVNPIQEAFWEKHTGMADPNVAELLDRMAGKVGADAIHRYLPEAHYWPERSIRAVSSVTEKPVIEWRYDRPRPVQLLNQPEPIEVTAPIPDYPPMVFRYKGVVHQIKKADGPERIEREWWLDEGQHRDYYSVEDEKGGQYWLFRLGHYTGDQRSTWFIHGIYG